MKKVKWFKEGILFIRNGDDYTCIPYSGFYEKTQLIKKYRKYDYTLYKDESSGVLSDFISFVVFGFIFAFFFF